MQGGCRDLFGETRVHFRTCRIEETLKRCRETYLGAVRSMGQKVRCVVRAGDKWVGHTCSEDVRVMRIDINPEVERVDRK